MCVCVSARRYVSGKLSGLYSDAYAPSSASCSLQFKVDACCHGNPSRCSTRTRRGGTMVLHIATFYFIAAQTWSQHCTVTVMFSLTSFLIRLTGCLSIHHSEIGDARDEPVLVKSKRVKLHECDFAISSQEIYVIYYDISIIHVI